MTGMTPAHSDHEIASPAPYKLASRSAHGADGIVLR